MKRLFLPVSLATLLLTNCKQELKLPERESPVNTPITPGLPEDPKTVSGYMYLSRSSQQSSYADAYAAFRDPAGDLMGGFRHGYNQVLLNSEGTTGNVNVGAVKVGSYSIYPNTLYGSIYYVANSVYLSGTAAHPTWSVNGGGSLKPFSIAVTRGFPAINAGGINTTVSSSVDWVIYPATVSSNFDSVIVAFEYSTGNIALRKSSSGSPIVFSKAELSSLRGLTYYLSIFAFNYSNAIVRNKVYVFELGNRYSSGIIWNP